MQGRVAHGTGDDDRADTCELVVHGIEPGHAPAHPEVVRVRGGIDRGHTHHEANPLHARQQACAPRFGERDLGLGLDEHGVGGPDGLDPAVVLFHMRWPCMGERRDTSLHHRPQPHVAGLGDRDRGFPRGARGSMKVGRRARWRRWRRPGRDQWPQASALAPPAGSGARRGRLPRRLG